MNRFIIFSIVSFMGMGVSIAAQYESGKFVGKTLDDQRQCSIHIDLSDDGNYARSNNVEYYLIPAYNSTPDVNCPGEHKRYVGFQTNGEENKEIEICVSLDGEFLEYRFEEFSDSYVEDEYICVIEKKVNS